MKKVILILLLMTHSVFADDNADKIKNLKYQLRIPITIQGMDLIFTPPANHHFNNQAPSKVVIWVKGKNVEPSLLKVNPAEAKASFTKKPEDCTVKSTLYICDDKNSYCVPKKQEFNCHGESLTENSKSNESAVEEEKVSQTENADSKLFILNDSKKAFEMAKMKNKPVMIDFFGIWCPPCNMLDETVFPSKDFLKLGSDFVYLKLDVDKSLSWDLKSKYKIKGYPTAIFARPDGEEIMRIVGSRKPKAFINEMKKALKFKNQSLSERESLADSGKDTKAAYELGLSHLDKEEFSWALHYLLIASRQWTVSEPKRNDLLSAQLGVQSLLTTDDDKKVYSKMLLKAIEWYPHSTKAVERSLALIKVAGDLKDEKLEQKANQLAVQSAEWLLRFPKSLDEEEWTKADLYQALGDGYEQLKELDKSKVAFKKAYDEYTQVMKAQGLNEKTERGYNLERIYCLWKSGAITEAQKMYESLEALYPQEFTFYYQHAHLLKNQNNFSGALSKSLVALKYSYGDNKLRVANLTAEIYKELGQKKEAINVIDEVTHSFSLPEDKDVRTNRYYSKLLDLRKKLTL